MASKIIIRGDETGVEAHGVYDDRFFCIFQALGASTPVVTRATEVEFDHEAGEWVAAHFASGEIIARGANRNKVIRQEIEWLEQREIV